MLSIGLSATGEPARGCGGLPPALIDLDFRQDRYVLAGAARAFDEVFAYGGTGLRTFTAADGRLVWNAHNLALNSETPASQTVAVEPGAAYTVAMSGSGSVELGGAAAGTATEGAPAAVTAAGSSLSLTVSGAVSRFWLYRCDLGGMADNPDNALGAGFEKYVPAGAAAASKPRRGAYVNGVPAGVILESGAGSNLLRHSADFANEYWTKTGVALTPAAAMAPDGTMTATRLVSSPGMSQHHLRRNSQPPASPGTSSIYVKQDSAGYVLISVGGTTNYRALFSFAAQSFVDRDAVAVYAEPLPGGWFRIAISGTASPARNIGIAALPSAVMPDHIEQQFQGNGESVFIWGAQSEAGLTPSSYIPAAAEPGFRPPETLAVRQAGLPAQMPEAVSFAMDGRMTFAETGDPATARFLDWQAGSGNYLQAALNTAGAAEGQVVSVRAHAGALSTAASGAAAYSSAANAAFGLAVRHRAALQELAVQGGTALGSPAPAALPDLAAADIGLAPVFSGSLGRFRLWDRDLGSAGIERVTA